MRDIYCYTWYCTDEMNEKHICLKLRKAIETANNYLTREIIFTVWKSAKGWQARSELC